VEVHSCAQLEQEKSHQLDESSQLRGEGALPPERQGICTTPSHHGLWRLMSK
jgi:hypothetical protein